LEELQNQHFEVIFNDYCKIKDNSKNFRLIYKVFVEIIIS